jgi:hypothetical protein
METFVICIGMLISIGVVIFVLKIIAPVESYQLKTSFILGSIGLIFYVLYFFKLLINEEYLLSFWPAAGIVTAILYIVAGGRTVAFKTQTGVFSSISGHPVGILNAGSLHWVDPFFERTTVDPGKDNVSANLKELHILIEKTDELQTADRGIRAVLKEISIMVHLTGDIREIFEIEGGMETILIRIRSFIDEHLIHEIGHIMPVDLDTDKKNTLNKLTEGLEHSINQYCRRMNYPYQVVNRSNQESDILIGDVELDKAYYEALALKSLTILRNHAKDEDARSLRERLLAMGKQLLPNGTASEQLNAAQISLEIVKKNINETKFGINVDSEELFKELVRILRGRN